MPMFILEAMAAGVPVITTSVGGIEELVGDAVKLVPVGDVHATAQAVVDLLERPDCIEELGRRGRELVRRSYSDDVVFRRLRALYEEAFSNGAESARDIEVRARP
jgi:glycosyltransferase involved in cell wall biosynthesis